MNSTTNLSEIHKCNYLDANLQPAKDMLLNCIGDSSKGEDRGCKSDYSRLYDPLAINLENIAIKRGVSAGYGLTQNNSEEKISSFDPGQSVNGTVEGFTGNVSISDGGPGEHVKYNGVCQEGHEWSDKIKACVQKCINCKYRDGMKSLVFPNVADQCFPEGVFDGITNRKNTKCTCGPKNQYCSDSMINPKTGKGDYIIKNVFGEPEPGASDYRPLHQHYSDEYSYPSALPSPPSH